MRCPTLTEIPPSPPDKTGWPWTEESPQLPDPTQDETPWPKVSIVTPSYNQGRFLEESIRSVLLQGYPDLEYIIIDGGSTDESVEIIKKYERWLAYWISEPDQGQSHAINKGLEKSTGKFFNWQNADDVLTPNSLAVTTAAFLKHPEVGSVHGHHLIIDPKSTVQAHDRGFLKGKEGVVLGLDWFLSNLKTHCQPGCLMDRELVLAAGRVDEHLHYVMDIDLGIRLAFLKPAFYIDYPVVCYRHHPQAKSFATKEKALERLMIAQKIFRQKNLPLQISRLKKQAFATAHAFAWDCYGDAESYLHALWHLFCEMRYLPLHEWRTRRKVLFKFTKKFLQKNIMSC